MINKSAVTAKTGLTISDTFSRLYPWGIMITSKFGSCGWALS